MSSNSYKLLNSATVRARLVLDMQQCENIVDLNKEFNVRGMVIRGGHISMGKFQSGFLKKHIIFPDCICFPV